MRFPPLINLISMNLWTFHQHLILKLFIQQAARLSLEQLMKIIWKMDCLRLFKIVVALFWSLQALFKAILIKFWSAKILGILWVLPWLRVMIPISSQIINLISSRMKLKRGLLSIRSIHSLDYWIGYSKKSRVRF